MSCNARHPVAALTTEQVALILDWLKKIDLVALERQWRYLTEGLPADMKAAQNSLADRAWFIWLLDGKMNDLSEKLTELVGADEACQDNYAMAYIQSEQCRFATHLKSAHPSRVQQIEQAIAAHDSGKRCVKGI